MDFIQFLNGFRKLTFGVLVLLISLILLCLGLISGKEFTDLIGPMSVAYMGANGLEHMTKAVISWMETKAPASRPPSSPPLVSDS